MAEGNKGICLIKYAESLYDDGHARILLHESFKLLKKAECSETTEDHARESYSNWRKSLEEFYSKPIEFTKHKQDAGVTKIEKKYRDWCLKRKLFLNPLNDLGNHFLAYRDIFGMPSITTNNCQDIPAFFKYYNILKQEYVSARYLFFEGINLNNLHFSDRNVLIYNTLDYSSHSLALEKIKLSYRSAYSILDKLAYFIKEYFNINIRNDRVYFKTIWYEEKNKVIRENFKISENKPLSALFWLSKDLFDDVYKENIEPDAEFLYNLRNLLEHRFLKLGMIPEKWTIKFHNFLHTLKVQDNQGQSAHEFDYKTPQYIL